MVMDISSSFQHIAEGISCHAWNKNHSMLALCPNTNEIWIFTNCQNKDISTWKKEHILTEHDMIVSGIDWSPITNTIVSCSHDRNAFVWNYDIKENIWKPSLVLLRINRAAINVKWSPDGKKFAVASGAKSVPVCYYEPSNDWWISKMIKKHKSTVLDIDWHPNSQFIATVSSDMKCRIFSAYIADLDSQQDNGDIFQQVAPFGEVMAEFDNAKGWTESVAWSPSGKRLAFCGHDSSIHFVHFSKPGDTPTIQSIRFRFLPFQKLVFLSESSCIGAGYDFNLLLFNSDSNGLWSYTDSLDKKSSDTKMTESGGFNAARSMWESKVSRGQTSAQTTTDKDALSTKHESAITYMQSSKDKSNHLVIELTTSGLDGRLVFWNLINLSTDIAKLGL